MLTRRGVLTLVGVLVAAGSASVAAAQSVSATVTADNHYAIYVGSGDGTQLRFVGRNEVGVYGDYGWNWTWPEGWAFGVQPEDYIYVVAWDDSPANPTSMWIGDFKAPGALLVSDRTHWQSMPIETGWPGPNGDPNIEDIKGAIASGGWSAPAVERPHDLDTGAYGIPFVHPAARLVWHDGHSNYVVFRAAATLLAPQPSCEDDLAAAFATIDQLNQTLATCNTSLTVCDASLTQTTASLSLCSANLASTQAALTAATSDADADGIPDRFDTCPTTAAGAAVDATGCSPTQFCAQVNVTRPEGQALCQALDWRNDEPLMRGQDRDCRVYVAVDTTPVTRRCAPVEQPQ